MLDEPPPSASVQARFVTDHRRIEALLEQLQAAFEANDREDIQRLWGEFESSLLVHLEAEEHFLVPSLLRLRAREARTILAEHKHIRARLTELGAGIELHIVRLDAARTFIEDLRAHARREEALYQWADAHLTEHERVSLIRALVRVVRAAVAIV